MTFIAFYDFLKILFAADSSVVFDSLRIQIALWIPIAIVQALNRASRNKICQQVMKNALRINK